MLDGSGDAVQCCSEFLLDFTIRDNSNSSAKSYSQALLRWFRFLWHIDRPWAAATREDVRDFVAWMKVAVKYRRRVAKKHIPGSVNSVTGKRYAGDGYAPTTINHNLSVVAAFYDFHVHARTGPLVNPVPTRVARDGDRYAAHHNPMRLLPTERRGDYRQKAPSLTPRHLSDADVDNVFRGLSSHRDRALIAFYLSSAARPAELLGLTNGMVRWDEQTITVLRKGTRVLQRIPASPDAFVWFNLYQATLPTELTQPESMAWWTIRKPYRPLGYDALRAVLRRVNDTLGANWSLHDLRHTAAMRMQEDPNMTLTDIQTILGHSSLVTTQKYLRPREADVFTHAQTHYKWLRERMAAGPQIDSAISATLAADYSAADMDELFGGAQ
ncbi:site-specific integrase (plasmid) [Mycobacterium avium subsp. hominissuis]|uniref:tyrosine-type recombinase/integrase n=1 Tax=Mycobacterium avium TaxID=1764 RepID=UPI00313FFF69